MFCSCIFSKHFILITVCFNISACNISHVTLAHFVENTNMYHVSVFSLKILGYDFRFISFPLTKTCDTDREWLTEISDWPIHCKHHSNNYCVKMNRIN